MTTTPHNDPEHGDAGLVNARWTCICGGNWHGRHNLGKHLRVNGTDFAFNLKVA